MNAPLPSSAPKRDGFNLFLMAACLALAALVLLLAWQNRTLKARLAASEAARLPADALKIGDRVDPFSLSGPGGRSESVEFTAGGPKTLLLVFSGQCPACEKTLPLWNDLFAPAATPAVRVLAVRTDRDEASLAASSLRFPVMDLGPRPPGFLERIPYVPAAVLLDGHGLVVKVWFGMPSEEQLGEMRIALEG